MTSTRRTLTKHSDVVRAARAARGGWVLAGVYASTEAGRGAARRIPRAERMPAYAPAGTFEAYDARHEDGTAVWVRYTAGLPKPAPRPTSMTYRVCDRGTGSGYVGVSVRSIVLSAECPRCGGPRGSAVPQRFHEDGDWYTVDKWDNPCGHVDTYTSVLAEYLRDRKLALDALRDHADLDEVGDGEYDEPVALLNALALVLRSASARDASRFLELGGYGEAGRRVEEERTARETRMTLRDAARYLPELAAARDACTKCDGGWVDYRGRDGEFVSLRCGTCRREARAHA
ncbi:hypothetical protein HUT18_11955 [Streptomyces sp. NA04227]|uniref:hypothetical protein n=1 Tax=Streptomyces sp. NA04227 TaxID=2742136 RepID=UPI001592287B|nr:hypothetical protein [Streptomyces sp. NA04227]QKW07012.1 hypothetical protein HUT18_11955 [Streptomyces sp. NA04227]